MRLVVAGLVTPLLLVGCTAPAERPDTASPEEPAGSTSASPRESPSVRPEPSEPRPEQRGPREVRVGTAWQAVRHLAGVIGPRHGTSAVFREAAGWVQGELEALGYDVSTQPFDVPGGVSWGVPVGPGRSVNVVATFGKVDTTKPHLVVGAHLDTVPQAPGAEDNASGVGALLAVAEAVAGRRTRLPVVLVAFGAEEPRGPGDDDHHYGSRAYVSRMDRPERSALRGMVSLDRVGVGEVMPVCSATESPGPLREELLRAARRSGVDTLPCTGNRASDHWSFVREGLPGARLGSTSYAGYHSAQDVPAVVDREQLGRAARITVAWLGGS